MICTCSNDQLLPPSHQGDHLAQEFALYNRRILEFTCDSDGDGDGNWGGDVEADGTI